MSESKPVQKTPAWLLVADRYMAEIAEAERLEAMAAAKGARRTGRARRTALGPTLIAQARSRGRAHDPTSLPALH